MAGQKQKYALKQEQKNTSSVNSRLALRNLQKHLSLIQLEEYLILGTFITGGILSRTLLQGIPSFEPITFFAILAGTLFGWKKGAITGASAWYLSNFFIFGGQGPWSIIQIAAGVVAGVLGGFIGKKTKLLPVLGVMIAATLFFEITMNVASGLFFGFGAVVSFLSAVPYMLIHLGTNVGLGMMIPNLKKFIVKKGRFDERELSKELITKIKEKITKGTPQ